MLAASRLLRITVVCLLCVCVAFGARSACAAMTAEQEAELQLFTGQLADPSRTAKTKTEAAELLLAREYPQAAEALRRFLQDPANRQAQVAVAEAIAAQGADKEMFVEPLMAMLTGTEPSVRAPAARALAAYRNGGVSARLLAVARDKAADKAVRLVTISAIHRVLDRQAVDALVQLVADHDTAIRNAAAESLARLTNIRAFGSDARRWKRWWSQNKDKPASAWLADLADSLAREKARLEDENTQLRTRLAAAMTDYYAATPAVMQDKLLLSFLKDPLADVRLVGVRLIDRRVSTGAAVPEELRRELAGMLADLDWRIREAAALLEANVGDPNAVELLLGRLKVEEVSDVKRGLLAAIGQMKDPNVVGAVLGEITSPDAPVAAAASSALARLAASMPLAADLRDQAAKTLLSRYRSSGAATANGQGPALREALLTAMGTLADDRFIPTIRGALKDPAATVRLAAVRGAAQLGKPALTEAAAALAGDGDRGIRQAVLDALGQIADSRYLPTVLKRTEPAVEPDAAVREKAWAVAMAILAKADTDTLAGVCDSLAGREDAAGQRIILGQMLVANLRAARSEKLPAATRQLAADLLAASRPAEAAPLLGSAYADCLARKLPEAGEVYLEWVDALLEANDPMLLTAMGDKAQAGQFAVVLAKVRKRLGDLTAEGKYAPVVLLGGEILRQLPDRLSRAEAAVLSKLVEDANARQLAADRSRVAKLAGQLLSADASAAKAASAELKSMGDRAVSPLIEQLRAAVAGEKPDAQAEKAIFDILIQIAPKLNGYDLAAARADRLKKIDEWLKGT